MIYCFVHAPNKDGWTGELVLALAKKSGKFRLADIQSIIRELYPDDDPDIFHYDQDVSEEKFKIYLERHDDGKMQRRSLYGSLEEMRRDDWEKSIIKRYPKIFFVYNPKHKETDK